MKMKLQGIAASQGIAIAKAVVWSKAVESSDEKQIRPEEVEQEVKRLEQSIEKSTKQLTEIHQQMLSNVGEEEANIMMAHLAFLQDPEFVGEMKRQIKDELLDATSAVQRVVKHFVQMFEAMENEYMRERATDIQDVGKRIINHLTGQTDDMHLQIKEPVIIVADDLTPSETVQLPRQFVLGIVTAKGGKTSHAAILSRSLEIPAVMGAGEEVLEKIQDQDQLIINGSTGEIWIQPDQATLKQYRKRLEQEELLKKELAKLRDLKAETTDGHRVKLKANLGRPTDIDSLLENSPDGIGLFRSEFLFMDRADLPSEEEQFAAYAEVIQKMNGKPVIIRTLDIGGDKHLPYLNLPEEMNPFLGWRAIRISLDQVDLFKTQLRAILRASVHGKALIMFPMISHVEQVQRAKEILEEVKQELQAKGVAFDPSVEVGIMIEIPSSCLIADELAKEVDFFSIGTNDLVQYTLAVDRMNEQIQHLYNYFHPAVLRLIKMVIDASHRHQIWTGMCGEMAGDPLATKLLLGLGLDEFSASANLLQVKKQIRSTSLADAKKVADHALTFATAEEVQQYLSQQSHNI
ncbi:phosphoenolpyruvate--protein phosphotransferase [Thermoflavimicrobium daqui]|jgi:phosphotransferase system enzyme I (PtsI)|uniref:Phosphoenolpyruvate-protein phosphotransferase n=1 Tax=Thermoflavimicrobium daqui TaxID=2137476 RepID=A0A364K4L1_9BACL|nr:phosphoenolpyruvate--protein phosphotransferase [Thermoflavimicrobium daqui]RAL24277.1 phosphoenolpyruvate--protein phosphotransferase [Thermoflavimicrobium daqui]